MKRQRFIIAFTLAFGLPLAAAAQLSPAWMIPAAAHVRGVPPTFWRTDVNILNPHETDLPILVQLLPSGHVNFTVDTLEVTLGPWETVNLWDILGPDLFDWSGTGALLVYADTDRISCDTVAACDFLATSRTYTLDPVTVSGEFGQAMPGVSVDYGLDGNTFSYAAGVMNDGAEFRANAGVASWTGEWVTVLMDIQNARGDIIDTEEFDVPPYGHLQRRVRTAVSGGAAVFYIDSGPADALVFPYLTVVNQRTGDPTYVPSLVSEVGVSVAAASAARSGPWRPRATPDRSATALRLTAELRAKMATRARPKAAQDR